MAVATQGARLGPEDLDELDTLSRSAGLTPVLREVFRRPRPDPAYYLGSGAAERIGEQIRAEKIGLVIFDHPISAIQQRNLERLWKVQVGDRTELIIEIFSQRARSNEGKLQVELARLQHQASRLVRMWSHLERQRGGIGVRGGPGETQLELDRRMIDDKIRRVRARLQKVERQRRTRRRSRQRGDALRVSLVGYTNAGKSTLFNRLTRAGTYAADQLFATLDPLTRRLRLDGGDEIILSDTVGFIRDLPHGLVAAFRATLEETAEADLLLHVVDAGSPDRERQIAVVNEVIREIGAGEVEQLMIFNKIDQTNLPPEVRHDAYGRISGLALSAVTGEGIDALRNVLAERAGAAGNEASSWHFDEAVDEDGSPGEGLAAEDAFLEEGDDPALPVPAQQTSPAGEDADPAPVAEPVAPVGQEP
ncbi:MAG: GTPase HflX [Lautropia sp.]|nr:GTPase HflX [Lautropia sp.]